MKKQNLRIALAQINSTVGDLEGNRRKIAEYIGKAKDCQADIVSFPELAITGYPPEDLLLKPKFIQDNLKNLKELTSSVSGIIAVVGFVDSPSSGIKNAAAIICDKKIKGFYHKAFLPNYGVFDEQRYFSAGREPLIMKFGGLIFGVNICEDIWHLNGPTKKQAGLGAELIININASPYHAGKVKEREAVMRKEARLNSIFIAYTNLVGGQDELVFDGQSMVLDKSGKVLSRAKAFQEDLLVVDLEIPITKRKTQKKTILLCDTPVQKERKGLPKRESQVLSHAEEIYKALSLGLYDYVFKNGFNKVVLGLSGGVDSSLVAAIAVDALGKDNVTGVFMPTRYSSLESEEDARKLAVNLGIKFMLISIEQIYKMYLMVFEPHFAGFERNVTEENIQARIRGNIVMALSNKFGWLVLTTGNKSEMSTGYATLYGDMAGGFAVIKDVPKTLVYELANYRNNLGLVIPERVLVKAPTAELRHNQKDADTLPEYEVLDPILKAYVEEDKEAEKIIAKGLDKDIVERVLRMVDRSEYKRRQSPPGIKITPKAFGRDRRMPITNKFLFR